MPKPFRFQTTIRKTARIRKPIEKLRPDLYRALSEKFHAECAKVTDPYEAAERIGCEIRVDDDGALQVLY